MDALFPISSYSSMMPLFYTGAPLIITFKLFKNYIAAKIKIYYTIKNQHVMVKSIFVYPI